MWIPRCPPVATESYFTRSNDTRTAGHEGVRRRKLSHTLTRTRKNGPRRAGRLVNLCSGHSEEGDTRTLRNGETANCDYMRVILLTVYLIKYETRPSP